MKKISLGIISIIILSCSLYAQTQENILFIGNSLTYYNDMPTLFQNIANSKGKNVHCTFYSPGGTGFINHVNDSNVYNLFSSQSWDAVILQPGTGESAGRSSSTDSTIARGQRLIDSIRRYSPCAKIILYEISTGIAPNDTSNNNYNNYFTIQSLIKDSITRISNGLQIPFAPAGECFKSYYTLNQNLRLHSSYGDVHPNLYGSYLVACSIFNTLYQEKVFPCNFYGNVPSLLSDSLQNISDSVVLTHKPNWNINTYNLWADFSFVVNDMNLQLHNLSTNYDSISWNINNEFSSNDTLVNYTFSSIGVKTITLTAYKDGCSLTETKQIDVSLSSLNPIVQSNLIVYPTVVKDIVNVKPESNSQITFYITDISGRIVIKEQKLNDEKINVQLLRKSIYIITLIQENRLNKFKFIKID
jgi:PKD repeat protein